jgi:hypothetical protein
MSGLNGENSETINGGDSDNSIQLIASRAYADNMKYVCSSTAM